MSVEGAPNTQEYLFGLGYDLNLSSFHKVIPAYHLEDGNQVYLCNEAKVYLQLGTGNGGTFALENSIVSSFTNATPTD